MSLAEAAAPATNLPAKRNNGAATRSPPKRIGGKLKTALDAMVWQGLAYDKAGKHAGLTTRNMRTALDKPHVRAYLKAQRDVFRESVNTGNTHALLEVRNQKRNHMARVAAVKTLEHQDNEQVSRGGHAQLPGLVIQVITSSGDTRVMEHHPQNEANPLIEHTPVRTERDE